MPGPIEAAGAIRNPTKYAAVTMNGEQFSGQMTQPGPYVNPAAYLIQKFYSGSRYDRIRDGINREISSALTDVRAPGSSVWNNNTWDVISSFYPWKYVQNGAELVRVMVDTYVGLGRRHIYDATGGGKVPVWFGTGGSPGPMRFLGVNTELFFGDDVDQKKLLASSKIYQANTSYNVGDFIVDSNGNLQSVQANPLTYNIQTIAVVEGFGAYFLVVTLTTAAPTMPANQTLTFAGLTNYAILNGVTLQWQGISEINQTMLNLGANQIAVQYGIAPYAAAADTGTMLALTASSGTTGNTSPAWATALGEVTNDGGYNGGVNWTNFGSPVQNWGIDPVKAANASYTGPLSFTGFLGTYWKPLAATGAPLTYALLDPNGNVQVLATAGSNGSMLPVWATNLGGITMSGTAAYINYGTFTSWYANTNYGGATAGVPNPWCVLDSNGNIQVPTGPNMLSTSGADVPAWNTTPGGTTSESTGLIWICLGPGAVLWSGVYQYSYSFHCIDGTVSTAAPVTLIANGGLGASGAFQFDISGTNTADAQCDQIWIWRTAQGQSSLILLDMIPNPMIGTGNTVWTYRDVSGDTQLNAEIPAPVASSANPPPLGFRPCSYSLNRVWGVAAGNLVYYSAGPDAVTGNGNTQFPPLNEIPFPGTPYAIFPISVQDGGQVVFTSSGVWIILGSGSSSDPFYARPYFQSVNVSGYNAVTLYNQTFYVIESNLKVSAMAVEYPFNPATGYTEIGFPIGDQFQKVTTGGISESLYSASSSFLSWNSQSTNENALYVADGAVGWFRMSPVSPPETGFLWSPRRAIVGGTSAVQAIETSPGVTQLLIGPASNGPILVRDNTGTVFADNGTGYPAWDAKGVNLLCSSGQWAEVAHISAKSAAVGARPVVSTLMNEIGPSTARPYVTLTPTPDPPLSTVSEPSESIYSDRYVLLQNNAPTTGDSILVKFDYGTQEVGDALLDWGILGSVHEEREEPVSKP